MLRTELSPQALHAEDVSQQHIQEYAGLHQRLTGLAQEHCNIERCLQNFELLNRLLDQHFIDFDEERNSSHEKHDVTVTTEQILRLHYQGTGQRWSPRNPGQQKSSNEFANYAAKFCAIASISRATRSHPRFCHSRFEVWDDSPSGTD